MVNAGIITIGSPSWEIADSYGRVALEVQRLLEARGWMVNTVGGNPPNKSFFPTALNLLLGHPIHFHEYGAIANIGRKFALTMWESTVLPPGWKKLLSDFEDVLVPCHWNVDLFKANGITAPIHRLPLGISSSYQYVERQDNRKFRFLVIGDRVDRKRWDKAFFAFVQAFGDRSDVELVFKSRFNAKNFGNRNVTDLVGDFTDEAMQELYASCDCMVFPASGEGFGYPPREFAATGGLAICTNYGGLADELPQWGIPLGYEMESAWTNDPYYQGLGEWGAADVDELAAKMVAVRNMPFALRHALGKAFSENVRSLYTWDAFGDLLVERLEAVNDGNRITA